MKEGSFVGSQSKKLMSVNTSKSINCEQLEALACVNACQKYRTTVAQCCVDFNVAFKLQQSEFDPLQNILNEK